MMVSLATCRPRADRREEPGILLRSGSVSREDPRLRAKRGPRTTSVLIEDEENE